MKKLVFSIALFCGIIANAQQLLEVLKPMENGEFKLPDTWIMEVNNNNPTRYLVSVYDTNYLPMNAMDLRTQPITANTTASAPDSTEDPVLNYQGRIGAYSKTGQMEKLDIDNAFEKRLYAVNIKLTPAIGNTQAINIPSTLSEAVIPAKYLKNTTQDVSVYLKAWFGDESSSSWKPTTQTEFLAYVVADREVELVQLDMNQGIGQDGKGILLTTFDVAGSPLELRLLPGVPDKYAGKKTNSYVAQGADLYEHDMFYMPVTSPSGGTWFSYDLGAYATNLKHPEFYPLAKGGITYLSAGSLYQWGRDSDGHELRASATSTDPKYGTTTTISTGVTPEHSQVITGRTTKNRTWFDVDVMEQLEKTLWLNEKKSYLWGMANSLHQPCPEGYNISKSNNLWRGRWNSNTNHTGNWADPFHQDNNLYGVGGGETYGWVMDDYYRSGSIKTYIGYYQDPQTGIDYVEECYDDYELGEVCSWYMDDYSRVSERDPDEYPGTQFYAYIAKRYYYRQSHTLTGPTWWLITNTSVKNTDRAPVRCVKE